jgi:hypothetical protein
MIYLSAAKRYAQAPRDVMNRYVRMHARYLGAGAVYITHLQMYCVFPHFSYSVFYFISFYFILVIFLASYLFLYFELYLDKLYGNLF